MNTVTHAYRGEGRRVLVLDKLVNRLPEIQRGVQRLELEDILRGEERVRREGVRDLFRHTKKLVRTDS